MTIAVSGIAKMFVGELIETGWMTPITLMPSVTNFSWTPDKKIFYLFDKIILFLFKSLDQDQVSRNSF